MTPAEELEALRQATRAALANMPQRTRMTEEAYSKLVAEKLRSKPPAGDLPGLGQLGEWKGGM